MIKIAVDAMSGDHGPKSTVPACLRFLKDHPDVELKLVGNQDIIKQELLLHEKSDCSFEIVHASDVVLGTELPKDVLRSKKESSMKVAIGLVKDGLTDAIVSSGNTGALMALSRYMLGMLEGVDRPAIAKIIPSMKEDVCMLDLGANVDASPQMLLQFAHMGSNLIAQIYSKKHPSVGLLNIGSEDIKGHDIIKQASELIKASSLNFYGNVEGDDIAKGTVDVVVCDGFCGNIALKSMEGMAKLLAYRLKEEFTSSAISKVMALFAMPVLNKLKMSFDPRKYNGAVLLGLNAMVLKSHGGADNVAFYYALDQAYTTLNTHK